MSGEPAGTMSATVVETPQAIRACLFNLTGELFAVDVKHAREVVVLEDYTAVPLAPAYLVGVANLRGYILPILDIRPLLGLPAQRVGRGCKVLVIGTGSVQIAIAIDGVLGLEWFGEAVPFGEAARRQYGELGVGLLERGDRLVTLLDAVKVLEALRVKGE